MGLKCRTGDTCISDCVKPCRGPALLQAEIIRDMSPTNKFFDIDDPRRVLKAPEPPTFDWRKILKVYIKAVLHQEGVTFTDNVSEDDLEPHEHAALLALDAEVNRETPYD